MACLLSFTETINKGIKTGKLNIAIKLILLFALDEIALIKLKTPEKAEELKIKVIKNIPKS